MRFFRRKKGKLVADNKKPVLNVVFYPTATGTHGGFTTCWTRKPDYGQDGLVIENDPHRTVESNRGHLEYLKQVELKNVCCHDLDELWHELRKAIARLRHKPHVLDGCIPQVGCYS